MTLLSDIKAKIFNKTSPCSRNICAQLLHIITHSKKLHRQTIPVEVLCDNGRLFIRIYLQGGPCCISSESILKCQQCCAFNFVLCNYVPIRNVSKQRNTFNSVLYFGVILTVLVRFNKGGGALWSTNTRLHSTICFSLFLTRKIKKKKKTFCKVIQNLVTRHPNICL